MGTDTLQPTQPTLFEVEEPGHKTPLFPSAAEMYHQDTQEEDPPQQQFEGWYKELMHHVMQVLPQFEVLDISKTGDSHYRYRNLIIRICCFGDDGITLQDHGRSTNISISVGGNTYLFNRQTYHAGIQTHSPGSYSPPTDADTFCTNCLDVPDICKGIFDQAQQVLIGNVSIIDHP